jgi:hypothetical protein
VGTVQRVSATSVNNSNSPKDVTVSCPAGTVVLGGGFQIGGVTNGSVEVTYAYPNSDTSYTARATEEALTATNANWTITAWALCA